MSNGPVLNQGESKLERRQRDDRQWVNGLLTSAQKRGWYGKITIEIRKGDISLVKSEESLKPPRD